MITPYIVKPADTPAALQLPTDDWKPPNDLERVLLLRQTGRNPASAQRSFDAARALPIHVPGDAGFIVE